MIKYAIGLIVLFAGVSPVYAAYTASGGCGSICFGECNDSSGKPMEPVKCPRIDSSGTTICKVLFGECARLENGQCGWKPSEKFASCLNDPKAYTNQYNALQNLQARQQETSQPYNCSESEAIKVVQSDPAFVKFCSTKINGTSYGCDYKAREPSQLNADEKNDPGLAWVVTASIIHSYNDKNQPNFMPEGAAFAKVSKDCKITSTMGPSALPLK